MNVPDTALAQDSVRSRVAEEEWAARVELAACDRLAAHFRLADLVYTHMYRRAYPDPTTISSSTASAVQGLALQGEEDGVESAAAQLDRTDPACRN